MSDTSVGLVALTISIAIVAALMLVVLPTLRYEPMSDADVMRELDRQTYGHATRSYSWLEDGIVTEQELRDLQTGKLR